MKCVYYTSHKLWVIFIAIVTSEFSHTSYELLFIAQVTSYFLTITIYNKDKDDAAVYDNNINLKSYSLGSFFNKELGIC